MSALRHPALHWVLGIVLGGVFLYAAHDKILDPKAFAAIVYHYRLIGPGASLGFVPANVLAVTLPWLEALCGVLLITGLWRREAAAVTAAMLVMFMGAVGYALYMGIDIANCGCFKVTGDGRSAGWKLIAGDAALLAGALLLAVVPARSAQAAAVPAVEGAPSPA